MPFTAIYGLPGRGKSLLMLQHGLRIAEKYRLRLVTNFCLDPLSLAYYCKINNLFWLFENIPKGIVYYVSANKNFAQFLQIKNAVILLDEMGLYAPSAQSWTLPPEAFNAVANNRKRAQHIVYAAQYPSQVHSSIHQICSEILYAEGMAIWDNELRNDRLLFKDVHLFGPSEFEVWFRDPKIRKNPVKVWVLATKHWKGIINGIDAQTFKVYDSFGLLEEQDLETSKFASKVDFGYYPYIDVRDTNILALNKIWHEVYEFQGSLIGTRYPAAGSDEPYKHFVDLNGSTLAGVTFDKVAALLAFCQFEEEFVANRIDIALDFPVQTPRLSRRYWEVFLSDNLLVGYRSIRRISNTGNNRSGITVYLGSRESERFVRIYDKNIDGTDYDRLEIEFKRTRAQWIMQEMVACPVQELSKFLNGVVCGQVNFSRQREDIEFFKKYKLGSISVPAPSLHLDIERSIAFIEKHCATLAMVEEFMGSERFDKFMRSMLAAGKLRMKPRHRTILENAKFLGVTALGVFLLLVQTSGAIASNLTCPAPVPLSFQVSQKFPIDIVQPTPAEQAYFNNIGDGCFQINAGLGFQNICLPGMIVNALKPFVIMGLGIKFIFSD